MFHSNATGLLALLCAVILLTIPVSAQSALKASDSPAVHTRQHDATLTLDRPAVERQRGATFYADRVAFDTAFPGLPLEDFEDVNVAFASFCSSPSPVNSTTDDECYAPGTIMAPIAIAAEGDFENEPDAIVAAGALFNGSRTVGANYFMDDTELRFNGGVDAVGFDMFGFATVVVEVYDTLENFPGSTTVFAGDSDVPYFVGVASSAPIGRILLDDDNIVNSTMRADNIAFQVSDSGDTTVMEDGDAGDIVTVAAQDETGATVELISGTVTTATDEDCYAISVTDASAFSAEVIAFEPDGDSQLFLFRTPDYTGIFGDDDGGEGGLSLISSANFSAGGGTEGDYTLCITAFNNDPRNDARERIFSFGSTTANPPNGDAQLASWDGSGSLSAPSDYDIRLTGVGGTGGQSFDLMTSGIPDVVSPADSFVVSYTITNNTNTPVSGDLYYTASRNSIQVTSAIIASGTVDDAVSGDYTQEVPSDARPGTYEYCIRIGTFNTMFAADSDCYTVAVAGMSQPGLEALEARLLATQAEAEVSGDKIPLSAAEAAYTEAITDADWRVVEASPWQTEQTEPFARADNSVGAYPNPFAQRTILSYELDEASNVRLVIYDVLGREVRVLVDGKAEASTHQETFDARGLATGNYIYRLSIGTSVQTGQLTLVR